jgi:peptidoglycan/LPS O-acetylase OafA/YrhL
VTERLGYRPELDGMRAVAVLAVFVWHTWGVLLPNPIASDPPLAGFLGVDIFFVLSGFLITTLLLEERQSTGTIRLLAFYGRRALRLVPALVVLIGIGWIAAAAADAYPLPYEQEALLTIAYVSNWFVHALGPLTHTWSLAIEEQYYLVWAVALYVCLARGVSRKVLGWFAIGAAIGVAVIRLAAYGKFERVLAINAFNSYSHIDGLLLGNAVALVPEFWTWVRRRWVVFLAVAGALAILFLPPDVLGGPAAFTEQPALRTGVPDIYFRGLLTVFAFCIAVLVARIHHMRSDALTRWLGRQPLPAIGRISYGLYLFHLPFFIIVAVEMRSGSGLVKSVVAWTASFACAIASYLIVERPALQLKSRLVPKGREHIPQWEGAPLGDST